MYESFLVWLSFNSVQDGYHVSTFDFMFTILIVFYNVCDYIKVWKVWGGGCTGWWIGLRMLLRLARHPSFNRIEDLNILAVFFRYLLRLLEFWGNEFHKWLVFFWCFFVFFGTMVYPAQGCLGATMAPIFNPRTARMSPFCILPIADV